MAFSEGDDDIDIESYFHKEFINKQIMLMLQMHHVITMHGRTLKRLLLGYGLKRRQESDNDLVLN